MVLLVASGQPDPPFHYMMDFASRLLKITLASRSNWHLTLGGILKRSELVLFLFVCFNVCENSKAEFH